MSDSLQVAFAFDEGSSGDHHHADLAPGADASAAVHGADAGQKICRGCAGEGEVRRGSEEGLTLRIQFVVPGTPVVKVCTVCKQNKALHNFGKDSSLKSGLMAACRECVSKRGKEYRKQNPEKASQTNKNYREKNKEKVMLREREYRERNKEKYSEHGRNWRLKNVTRHRELQSQWRSKNKDHIAEYDRRRREQFPEMNAAKCRNRFAMKKKAKGKHSGDDVKKLFKMQRGKCAICKCGISAKYHVDHIVPISKGGSNGPENIQLLCPPCNLAKGAKNSVDFMQEKGYLL